MRFARKCCGLSCSPVHLAGPAAIRNGWDNRAEKMLEDIDYRALQRANSQQSLEKTASAGTFGQLQLVCPDIVDECRLCFTPYSSLHSHRSSASPASAIGDSSSCEMQSFTFWFEPPEFIDRGFSDLTKYEQYWKMKHKIFSYCATQGYRPYMEDRMHYMYDPNMNLSIFGIFDGHGGMAVSHYLESNFAKSIRERLLRQETRRRLSIEGMLDLRDPIEEMFVREVLRLDDTLSQLSSVCTSLTGSTMIAAIMEANRYLSVINVGDSRAVACDLKNQMVSLSKDHKPNDPIERKRIENAGGYVSFENGTYRVQGILAVSRSFGDTMLKRLGVLTVNPDVLRIDLGTDPLKFLIVGTDGFWDVVSSQEAVKLANDYLTSHDKRDWHRISTFLVQIALRRHTLDNISVLFIKLL
ncbi:unnamed protein product [Cylicocyclus nassatus]|uniref:PPM-type phosphatase domain-containing protein n=1 Tax=Cylicocyclus nassatus TaxID=53992 RepID=A0AA36HFQ0_CYLNA|nr:unnamed protein product [Cylicocyclus nassatus]